MSDQLEARKMQLIHDLRSVIRDTKDLMHVSLDDGKKGSEEIKKSIAVELGRTIDRLQRIEAYAGESIQHSAQRAKTYVQNHPVQAIGLSAGVGLLAGLLMSRR